jgi:predicted nucleotidyltransferase
MIYQANPLRILSFLSLHRKDDAIYGSRVAADLRISQGSTSEILRKFADIGLVRAEAVGRTLIYRVQEDHPLLAPFRVVDNIVELQPLIVRLRPLCRKVILFGSCAAGSDDHESDIDLFVLADDPEVARYEIDLFKDGLERELRPVIVSPMEWISMEETDPVFMKEIEKGRVLWEATDV